MALSTAPDSRQSTDFRCAPASEARGDDPAGTATHVRAFLLVEDGGPWGLSAPRDSRLPDEVKGHLRSHRSIRVLLARRHRRTAQRSMREVMLCFPARRLLLRTSIEETTELLDLDLDAVSRGTAPDWEQVEGPVYGVCTHGRHDACCAERGRPVCAALTEARPEQTWEVSHIGGDRFAANLLVLPEGLYYGRLAPDSVVDVAELHESGRVDLDRWRGRTSYPMSAQYAETALRRHLAEDRLDAVRLVASTGSLTGATHDFACSGGEQTWRVAVIRTLAEETQLTCAAVRLDRVPVFTVAALHRL